MQSCVKAVNRLVLALDSASRDRVGAAGEEQLTDIDTQTAYERAGIGQRIQRGIRPGVLVVDFSAGFTQSDYATGADLSQPVQATRELLDAARAHGVPVFFTTIAYEPSLRDAGVWLQKMPGLASLLIGSAAVEIDERLQRRPDEPVIVKKGASAFFGTNLAALLAAQRLDTLVVCGATTSGCVRASVIDSVQNGFPTLVPAECVGDRARVPHETNLFDIDAKYADVVALPDVVDFIAAPERVTA